MKFNFRKTRYRGPVIALAVLVMVLGATPALALTTTWIGPSGNWNVPGNWDNGVPALNDDAFLTSATSKTATLDTTTPLLNSVIVDGTGGAAFTLTQTYYPSGNLSASAETIGLDGIGVYNHNAGSNTVGSVAGTPIANTTLDRTLVLGFRAGSSGTYNKNGGTLTTWDLMVGRAGTGEFNLPSGNLTVNNNLILGRSASGIGTFNLSSGGLQVGGNEIIGFAGVGNFNHSSGSHTIGGALTVGRDAGSIGTFKMSSGSLQVGGNEIIGAGGDGSLTHTSGSHTIGGNLILGRDAGTTGKFTMTSGSLTVGGLADIGRDGTGNFTMTSGSVTTAGLLTLAKNPGSTGNFTVTSGSVTSNNTPLADGNTDIQINSGGTFNVTAATVTGDVVNDGTVNVGPKGKVTWNGTFTNNNAYISDRSTQTFNGNLEVGANGYLVATHSQDMFIVKGDFINQSTQSGLWNTEQARLRFAKGSDATPLEHDFFVPGVDNGVNPIANNYNWRLLNITNQTIYLKDGNATAGGAQYVKVLLGAVLDVSDPLNLIVTNIFGDPDSTINIYYNETLAQNAYLDGKDYHLANGYGMLLANVAVPLPPSVLLLGTGLLGLGALGWRRRKKA